MNILKWLKDKTGKLPISLAQAAGITAVVGAAGFGAMSFLSSPADNNNTFMPPSVNQGQVVYVSQQGGGGQYEANGEVGSSFKAAPSRAIQLANQEAARQAQTRALEEAAGHPSYTGQPGEEVNPQLPKAYQVSNADLGLGMGSSADKQLNSSLEAFSTLQNQLSGVTAAVNNAQAQAAAGQTGKPAPQAAGQTAAQLASAPRNWGSGGLTRAGGGGSSSSNSFVIQNSGKNATAQDQAAATAQAGDAIAQAQAAMAQLREGARMQSRTNFGNSDGLGQDKDADLQRARRFNTKGKDDLTFIRKQTAAINKNKTNAANEGGNPFLASTKLSGGLTVNGEQVTTGQSASGDLRSTSDAQLRGIGAKLGQVQENVDEQDLARNELKQWMWAVVPAVLASILAIAILVRIAKHALFASWPYWLAAAALTAGSLLLIYKLFDASNIYRKIGGADTWSSLGYALSAVLTAGVGASWMYGLLSRVEEGVRLTLDKIGKLTEYVAFGAVGGGIYKMLFHKDEYLHEIEEANQGKSQTQQQNEEMEIEGGEK